VSWVIDMWAGLVRIETAVVELKNGSLVTGPPKSLAGVRWVSIPAFLLADITEHLEQFTDIADDCLVFTGPKGAQLDGPHLDTCRTDLPAPHVATRPDDR